MKKDELIFKWKWCGLCKCAYVECPVCGNNLCNAMSGKLKDGSECPYCYMGYQYQDLAYKYIVKRFKWKKHNKNEWSKVIKKLNLELKDY